MQPDTIINEVIGKLINILMTSFPRTEEDPGLAHIFLWLWLSAHNQCLHRDWPWHLMGCFSLWVCMSSRCSVTYLWTLSFTICFQILTNILIMTLEFIFTFCFYLLTKELNGNFVLFCFFACFSCFWKSLASLSWSALYFLNCFVLYHVILEKTYPALIKWFIWFPENPTCLI